MIQPEPSGSGPLEPLDVTVVIPAHNAADTLIDQLEALHKQDAGVLAEVIVVDSCSDDGTAEVVETFSQRWPKVRCVRADRPGANAARNVGIAQARTAAVLLCDADDVVSQGWVAALAGGLARNDLVRGWYDVSQLNDQATIGARGPLESASLPEPGAVFGGLGGNCGFRLSAWQFLGGLAEHHYGADDAEFFWRAHLAGLRVAYVADAVVNYRLRPGYDSLYRQQVQWAASRALLYREFRTTGLMHRRSTMAALRAWVWLGVHLTDRRSSDPKRRGQWVRTAAQSMGRVQGSMRHRVYFP